MRLDLIALNPTFTAWVCREANAMLTMEDLKPNDCRWPAEAQDGEMLYCGEPALNDCPYCAVHAAIAYKPAARHVVRKAATLPPILATPVEARER
jgi:hypothetical protein